MARPKKTQEVQKQVEIIEDQINNEVQIEKQMYKINNEFALNSYGPIGNIINEDFIYNKFQELENAKKFINYLLEKNYLIKL